MLPRFPPRLLLCASIDFRETITELQTDNSKQGTKDSSSRSDRLQRGRVCEYFTSPFYLSCAPVLSFRSFCPLFMTLLFNKMVKGDLGLSDWLVFNTRDYYVCRENVGTRNQFKGIPDAEVRQPFISTTNEAGHSPYPLLPPSLYLLLNGRQTFINPIKDLLLYWHCV